MEATADALLAAWQALAADPDSGAAFAEAVLPGLLVRLAALNPRADDGDILSAAGDAVLGLIKNPASYDPARRSLAGYLVMSAQGDLRNRLKAEGRHHRRRAPLDSVELGPAGRNSEEGRGDAPALDGPELRPVLAALSGPERRVLELLLAGERSTAAFAGALGLAGLPPGEQEAEVKRAKDRIKARLKRAVSKRARGEGGDA